MDYDISLTETAAGASSHYTGTFPVVVAGAYRVTFFEGSPAADADDAVAQGVMYWDGTNVIDLSSLTIDQRQILNVYPVPDA